MSFDRPTTTRAFRTKAATYCICPIIEFFFWNLILLTFRITRMDFFSFFCRTLRTFLFAGDWSWRCEKENCSDAKKKKKKTHRGGKNSSEGLVFFFCRIDRGWKDTSLWSARRLFVIFYIQIFRWQIIYTRATRVSFVFFQGGSFFFF